MPDAPLVFAQTFEGLFHRGLQSRLTPALESHLCGVGLDLKRLELAYPVAVWLEALRVTADVLHPELAKADAYQSLGERFLEGYGETLIGRAMMGVLRVVGTRRALQRMERNFRSGNNYVRSRFVEHGPEDVELLFDCLHEPPTFITGVILAGGRMLGAKNVRITVSETAEPRSYRITWTP